MSYNPNITNHQINEIYKHMIMSEPYMAAPILYSDEQLMRTGYHPSGRFLAKNGQDMFHATQFPFTGNFGNGYSTCSIPLIPVKHTTTHIVIGSPKPSNHYNSSYLVSSSQVSNSQIPDSQQSNTNQPKSYPIEPGVVHSGKPVNEFSELSQEYQNLIAPVDPTTGKRWRGDEFRYQSSRIYNGEFQVYFSEKSYDEYLAWLPEEDQQTTSKESSQMTVESSKESSLMTIEQFIRSNGLKLIMDSFLSKMEDDEDVIEMINTLRNNKTHDNELKENLACIISGMLMTIAYSEEFVDCNEIVSIRNILDKRNMELAKKLVTIIKANPDSDSNDATSKKKYSDSNDDTPKKKYDDSNDDTPKKKYELSYKGVKTYKL